MIRIRNIWNLYVTIIQMSFPTLFDSGLPLSSVGLKPKDTFFITFLIIREVFAALLVSARVGTLREITRL